MMKFFIFTVLMKRFEVNITPEVKEEASKILELLNACDTEAIYLGIVYLKHLLTKIGICLDTDGVSCVNQQTHSWDIIHHLALYQDQDKVKYISGMLSRTDVDARSGFWVYNIVTYLAGMECDELTFYRKDEND